MASQNMNLCWVRYDGHSCSEIHNFSRGKSVFKITLYIIWPLKICKPHYNKGKVSIRELGQIKLTGTNRQVMNIIKDWEILKQEFTKIIEIKVTKEACYDQEEPKQLHILHDTSNIAYGAVAYCNTENYCNSILSKAKVAPRKWGSGPGENY